MGLSLILFGDKSPMPTSRAAASGVDSPLMLLHGCEAGVGSLEGGGPSGGRRGDGSGWRRIGGGGGSRRSRMDAAGEGSGRDAGCRAQLLYWYD